MAIVWPWELSVDEYAGAGRAVAVPRPLCPGCQAAMVFCGWYRRAVRDVGLVVYLIEVRRARCRACRGQDHALLPSFCLRGRLDVVEVIGSAVSAVVMDKAVVTAPAEPDAGVPATTVRGWVRAHRRRAEGLLAGLVGAAGISGRHECVAGSIAEAALAAVVELGSALAERLGVRLVAGGVGADQRGVAVRAQEPALGRRRVGALDDLDDGTGPTVRPVVVTATSADQPEAERNATVVAGGELDADLAAGLATWSLRAACRGVGVAVFFDRAGRGGAAPMCSRCAVAEACLWWAMAVEEGAGYRFGLWGGTTPTLRSRIARAAGPGYARHRLRLAMTALSEGGGGEMADGWEAA